MSSFNHILPALAAAAFVLMGVWQALRNPPNNVPPGAWRVPAVLSAAFFGWSLVAISTEGPVGFWPEHVRNNWGNQIWFDLLLGVGTAFILLLPRLRAVAMRPLPWFLLIAATGSIGLLATLARCLYLEGRRV